MLIGFLLLLPVVACKDKMTPYDVLYEYRKSHHPLQRPLLDQTSVINVSIAVKVINIEELVETKQSLTVSAYFHFVWTMEGLEWNATHYQNTSHVSVFPSDIWIPDFVLINSNNEGGYLAHSGLPADVFSNGRVEWYPFDKWELFCKMDVTRFPFDSQSCQFMMHQWNSFIWEVNYIFQDPPFTFWDFQKNGEWDLYDHKAFKASTVNGQYHKLRFELCLVRRSSFYILAAVLPACVLSALNLLVFYVPPGSGEKLTYCVSIFLSYAVYLTYINSMLPSVSDHVSFFSIYLNCMFALKAVTIVTTVFVFYLHTVPQGCRTISTLTKWLMIQCRNTKCADPAKASIKLPNAEEQRTVIINRFNKILFFIFFSWFACCTVGFFVACIV